MATLGIDFGTTNSLVSLYLERENLLRAFTIDELPHPSIVWFRENGVVVGAEAKKHLGDLEAPMTGNFVRSPKFYLGAEDTLEVGGVRRELKDIIGEVFRHLRADMQGQMAETKNVELDSDDEIVLTIPVTMKGPARRILRRAAAEAGFRIRSFVHEPLAALYAWLRSRSDGPGFQGLERDRFVVFDWGGGTLDLTACELREGQLHQVANTGHSGVGGDKIDRRLADLLIHRHLEKHPGLSRRALRPEFFPRLLDGTEKAKIDLSSGKDMLNLVSVSNLFDAPDPAHNLRERVTQTDLEEASRALVDEGLAKVDEILRKAGWDASSVTCLAIGGTVGLWLVPGELRRIFGAHRVVVPAHGDRIISEGAAWIAHDKAEVTLSKGVYLEEASDGERPRYTEILPGDLVLPTGEQGAVSQKVSLWCVDPKEGFARARLSRPRHADGKGDPSQQLDYGQVAVMTDSESSALEEPLSLKLSIDQNLIMTAELEAMRSRDKRAIEIHDLEFCVRVRRP